MKTSQSSKETLLVWTVIVSLFSALTAFTLWFNNNLQAN